MKPIVEILPVPYRFEDNGETIFATVRAITDIPANDILYLTTGQPAGVASTPHVAGEQFEVLVKGEINFYLREIHNESIDVALVPQGWSDEPSFVVTAESNEFPEVLDILDAEEIG